MSWTIVNYFDGLGLTILKMGQAAHFCSPENYSRMAVTFSFPQGSQWLLSWVLNMDQGYILLMAYGL